VARHQGLAVFVDLALPGQRVRARLDRVKPRFAEARTLEVLSPGPDDVAPPCRHFGPCGGCDWQHLAYPAQLEWKRRLVADGLRRLARLGPDELPDGRVAQTLASPATVGFRNKMEFAFAGTSGGDLSLGLRRRHRPAEVLDVEGCLLMPPPAMDILATVRDFCRTSGLPAWDMASGQGCWRFLTLRCNRAGQFQAMVLTAAHPRAAAAVATLARELAAFPAVVSVVHGLRRRADRLAEAEETRAVAGAEVLVEERGRHPATGAAQWTGRESGGRVVNLEGVAQDVDLTATLARVRIRSAKKHSLLGEPLAAGE